ncbi:MAG: hypothetical protein HQM12_09375 [SAR324 cluster bacterium]|nr:hypothetical protein [SAR324 cluster bacterium]MBF0349551.1 hypothetical protein [SAR324 cluster bacterium]
MPVEKKTSSPPSKLVRRKFLADDPMVKTLIREYSSSNKIRGIHTEYEGEGENRVIKYIEFLIRE